MTLPLKVPEKKILAIVKPNLAPLVRALGIVDIIEVFDEAEVLDVFKKATKLEDVGIILIQKSLVECIPASILEDIHSKLYPVLVALPDSVEELKKSPAEIYKDLARKFIGFEIHL